MRASGRSGEERFLGKIQIKIRNISDFSQAVGRVLQEIVFHEKYLHNILRYSMIVQSVKVTKSSERTFLKWLYR